MDRLTWDEYFTAMAVVVAMRSPDKFRKVGAVCISKENRILSCGYNGLVAGFDTPIGLYDDREKPDRFIYTIHAETNALSLCKPNEVFTMALTCSPCQNCAKMIAAYGVKRVLYSEEYHRDALFKQIFDFYKIEYKKVTIPKIFLNDTLDILNAPLI
jgi:dCMP deaminase